ncbi:MAG: hypothetical protein JEZ00_11550 [Anaerolineaceae bacterium]|nr:hypothetical protein [Anaerolineaceae bacterium]
MIGRFCRGEIRTKRDINGYNLKVIVDPTRLGDDPGLFYGGLFRMIDLRLDRDEISTWPDGIVFEHTLTGQQFTYKEGKLFDLTNNLWLVRKPRIRMKRGKAMKKRSRHHIPMSQMRRFILVREQDVTGVSGTGVVAEGAVFTDGLSVIHWLREPYAMGVYQSLKDVMDVHGHEGGTELQFIDGEDRTMKHLEGEAQ